MFEPYKGVCAICAGFIAGCAWAAWGFENTGAIQLFWFFLLGALLSCICMLFVGKVHWCILVCAVIGIGAGVFHGAGVGKHAQELLSFDGKEIQVQGKVVEVSIRESHQHMVLDELVINGSVVDGRVRISTRSIPRIQVGWHVQTSCMVKCPEPFEGFAYDRFLGAKDIWLVCYTREVLVFNYEQIGFLARVHQIREIFIGQINRVFGEPHASLLVGLLLGEERFSYTWKERFLQTGTTHIVAASGYNISVVLYIAMGFFAFIGVKRQRAFAFLVSAVVLYIALAGADAAVFRAGVMGIVLLVSKQSGRKTSMVPVVLLTACIMLAINARLIRDDVGFQLSMLSTIGLIWLAPKLTKWMDWIPERWLLRESALATLSATLMSLPVLIVQFGSFSFISILVNICVLPWVPLAMAAGTFATLVGSVSIQAGALMSAPAWFALHMMLTCISFFASWGWFAGEIPLWIECVVCLVWSFFIVGWAKRALDIIKTYTYVSAV